MAQPFKFIHCGDLHLGAPFTAIPSLGKFVDDAVLQSTYKAFTNIVDLAIDEHVDAVLISGDIYNEADHNLAAQVRFVRELERLSDKNIKVFIVHGNHDPINSWVAKIKMPEGIHVFSGEEVERKTLIVRGREVATIYGISHSKKGITEDLSTKFNVAANDNYSIGVLHASVGSKEGHDLYAPTTLEKLLDVGMDYWALGHIHKREILHDNPYVIYAGNTQGLKRNEVGPKGCYLVRISATGQTDVEFKDISAIIFDEVEIDISKLKTIQDIQEMIRHKKKLIQTKYKKPCFLSIILKGQGELTKVCQDKSARELLLQEAQSEEKGKFNFTMPIKLIDETSYNIDLKARRLLPDVLGDYLAAYDEIATLSQTEKESALYDIVANRPEAKRLGKYVAFLDNEVLEKAFKCAEVEGAIQMVEAENED